MATMGFEVRYTHPLGHSDDSSLRASPWAVGYVLATNVVTVFLATTQHWPLALLLVPYWVQTLVIGWYSYWRILELRQFSVEGYEIDGKPATESDETRELTAQAVLSFTGLFSLVQAALFIGLAAHGKIASDTDLSGADIAQAGLACLLFVFAQHVEHRRNLAADQTTRPRIGVMFARPGMRMIPMQFAVLAIWNQIAGLDVLLSFGVLKTAIDLLSMLYVERRLPAATAPPAEPAHSAEFDSAIRARLARSRERLAKLRSRQS